MTAHDVARLLPVVPVLRDLYRSMAVRHVHALRPLTQAVVTALNADLTLKDLAEDLAASRYPSVAG